MYWFLAGNLFAALPWLMTMLIWLVGGVLIATCAFHLEPDECLPAGFGIGLVFFVFFINLLGRFLAPNLSFGMSGGIVRGCSRQTVQVATESVPGPFHQSPNEAYENEWFCLARGAGACLHRSPCSRPNRSGTLHPDLRGAECHG